MTDPKVSVLTSVYNGEAYVEASLRSVLLQEGVPFEVIAVNDGSTDGSGERLEALSEEFPHLRVIHQANVGLTRALVRACAEARGVFLARHDADDISLPGRLASQASALEGDPSLSFVSSAVRFIGPRDEFLRSERRNPDVETSTAELLDEKQGVPHGSVMMRASSYRKAGGYRDVFYYAQDADLWLRLAEVGRFRALQEEGYAHRILPDSISSGRSRNQQSVFGRLGQACRSARRNGKSEAKFIEEAQQLSDKIRHDRRGKSLNGISRSRKAQGNYFIGCLLAANANPAASTYFQAAVHANPLLLRAWMRLWTFRRSL